MCSPKPTTTKIKVKFYKKMNVENVYAEIIDQNDYVLMCCTNNQKSWQMLNNK